MVFTYLFLPSSLPGLATLVSPVSPPDDAFLTWRLERYFSRRPKKSCEENDMHIMSDVYLAA